MNLDYIKQSIKQEPFFECEDGLLYCADCMDILPQLPDGCVDLCLTDPPYGIGRDGCRLSTGSHGGRKAYDFKGWDSETPPQEVFESIFRVSGNQIIWGGNYFTQYLPAKMGWIVWDKGQRICGSDAELAFGSFDKALRVVTYNRVELLLDGAVHPTQKPIALMSWCIEMYSETGNLILDPFLGSGTTAVAAKRLSRKFIGIEILEEYCRVAKDRIQAEQKGISVKELKQGQGVLFEKA